MRGIVLRRWDSGESDRRIVLLTREAGKITAVARGARKGGSKLAGVTEPFCVADFQLAAGRTLYVTQAQPVAGFGELRLGFERIAAASAWAEILDKAIHAGGAVLHGFELAVTVLHGICHAREPLAPLCWGDIRLMEGVGFAPSFASAEYGDGGQLWISTSDGTIVQSDEPLRHIPVSPAVAISLRKLRELEGPPEYLRGAKAVVDALGALWEHLLEVRLPARRTLTATG
ncbi:MAG: DNA repair protein RecO [Fimbriimonadales bacterium]|nr:DNA repair protein RecO [Fimbriimonadales bacterium]